MFRWGVGLVKSPKLLVKSYLQRFLNNLYGQDVIISQLHVGHIALEVEKCKN